MNMIDAVQRGIAQLLRFLDLLWRAVPCKTPTCQANRETNPDHF